MLMLPPHPCPPPPHHSPRTRPALLSRFGAAPPITYYYDCVVRKEVYFSHSTFRKSSDIETHDMGGGGDGDDDPLPVILSVALLFMCAGISLLALLRFYTFCVIYFSKRLLLETVVATNPPSTFFSRKYFSCDNNKSARHAPQRRRIRRRDDVRTRNEIALRMCSRVYLFFSLLQLEQYRE